MKQVVRQGGWHILVPQGKLQGIENTGNPAIVLADQYRTVIKIDGGLSNGPVILYSQAVQEHLAIDPPPTTWRETPG